MDNYDQLYADKLDLLMTLNSADSEFVTWSGATRPAIDNLAVVPRPLPLLNLRWSEVWSLEWAWLSCPAIDGPGGVATRSRDTR